jgi:hypothetical protein
MVLQRPIESTRLCGNFLLQHAYTVHLGIIDQLIAPRFSVLWDQEFGSSDDDSKLMPIILEAIDAVREAYRGPAGV